MKKKFLPVLIASLLPLALAAQVKKSPDAATVTLSTAKNPATPSLSLALKAGEAIRTFDVPLQSDEDKSTEVYGVQTTGGLYVVDYPKTIKAKGKSVLTLIYVARANSTGDTDFVRLMTDKGEKVIELKHDREQVAQFDKTSLEWQQGEAASAKTFTITVAPDSVVPKAVKTLGGGATATLQSLGSNRYSITVTPVSTAKVQQFPVTIQFSPALPGLNTVVSCAVVPKG